MVLVQEHPPSGANSSSNGGNSTMNAAPIVDEQACPALRYAHVNCPVWNNSHDDGGPGVDYRVRWVHKNQNPPNCSQANYLIRGFTHWIGFGANVALTVESTMYIALYSHRIMLLDPNTPFRHSHCEEKTWECYFQPLSHCTIADAEAIVKSRGGVYDKFLTKEDNPVIRPSAVSRLSRIWCFISCGHL